MEADLIYDIGMCDGADTAFYLAKGFRVVAIEANPALIERARERFASELRKGRLKILPNAIGPTQGRVQFCVHRRMSDWSTLNPGVWPADEVDVIEVDCVTFGSVLRRHGTPYYLKIDIEGADVHAISSLNEASDLPIYVSAEAQTPDIVDKLYDLGYRGFKLVDQAPAARNALPWIPKEGRYVDLTFGGHHSGPFGEETPGQWRTREEVLQDFHAAISAPTPSWYDFHARLPIAKNLSWHGARDLASFGSLPITACRHGARQLQAAMRRTRRTIIQVSGRAVRTALSPAQFKALKAFLIRHAPWMVSYR